ncbi:cobalt ABC transporter ATP-binding protein [Coprothermobacter proteolyticus DSM 5265]|uniref:Cobalt import ATP-binding protein CbiO n=1 Tax=Coprothermobacter proteolyticus (strain ATCC 35245 / DSM 5265 / OCM 4 / BT) TaxID=309798 RepID=B5Y759_COPPD|nr:ABC transporter ATP-binding protein [Coprothermobacter proteolyticus]ACI16777.1 cobalt ABC transporter ATP-binding protein [Coprothermobacter proteolyticus DSM 5265]
MNLIEVDNVSFAYTEGIPVLKNVTFSLNNGSVAIIGQNGSGKTTLVKLLKALLKPISGDIFINGINTKETTAAKLARTVGLVFQNPNDQIFKNKVLDEVMFGPLNIGQSMEEARENAIKALETVSLVDKKEENPYDLSLSERKLVSIASILSMDTDIVILDEPTIAQDYLGKAKIRSIVHELVQRGKLVITITHDMDFVGECFQRVIVLSEGQLLLDGPAREVFSKEDVLRSANLEPPYVAQLSKTTGYQGVLLSVEEFVAYYRSAMEDWERRS